MRGFSGRDWWGLDQFVYFWVFPPEMEFLKHERRKPVCIISKYNRHTNVVLWMTPINYSMNLVGWKILEDIVSYLSQPWIGPWWWLRILIFWVKTGDWGFWKQVNQGQQRGRLEHWVNNCRVIDLICIFRLDMYRYVYWYVMGKIYKPTSSRRWSSDFQSIGLYLILKIVGCKKEHIFLSLMIQFLGDLGITKKLNPNIKHKNWAIGIHSRV